MEKPSRLLDIEYIEYIVWNSELQIWDCLSVKPLEYKPEVKACLNILY